MTPSVYIALGSNQGDRRRNLHAAIGALSPAVETRQRSAVYETAPWGFTNQPNFLNQVVHAETDLSPQDLLSYLKRIEQRLGRQATFRFGPRTIDLDLLLYDDLVLETDRLVVPHPHMAERAFVLVPLADLAPDLIHPVLRRTITELVQDANTSGVWLAEGAHSD